MTPIYNAVSKILTPAKVKNAKAKVIEPYFGQLNKKYCQQMQNWSGFGITSNKNKQPNTDFLNANKHTFPDREGCYKQIESIIGAERNEKLKHYLLLWQNLPQEKKIPLSEEEYLFHFGAETGFKNTLEGNGLLVTIEGVKRAYDCFDIRFRQHAHVRWTIKYDPQNKEKVLAINKDGTLRFLLEEKHLLAAAASHANYAFYLGANHNNIEEVKKMDSTRVPGVKVFMGASTGNMLVDRQEALERIFKESPVLIATHCEDEEIIRNNLFNAQSEIFPWQHPEIRSREACLKSTEKAILLAQKYQSRLHILHLTTKEEVELLASIRKSSPNITGEACVHHLFFTDHDYQEYGNLIKCNPAIKSIQDREALREAVKKGVIEVVGTDHAPHTLEEKQRPYLSAPSGIPMIQHSLPLMFGLALEGIFTPEQVISCMCHAPALNFGVFERGFIRKGYYADLVLIDTESPTRSNTLLYKCGWSPISQTSIPVTISHTFVNGKLAYSAEKGVVGQRYAQPLTFIHKKHNTVE